MLLGTSFSQPFASFLGINLHDFQNLFIFNFDYIRLCCYWNEVQKYKQAFDFSPILSLLNSCENKKQGVIVTIGMKAPRYPEFYIPPWIGSKDPVAVEKFVRKLDSTRKIVVTLWGNDDFRNTFQTVEGIADIIGILVMV